MVLAINEVINGKYKILSKLNDGGMSIVYLAHDINLNKQWAVKEITKQKTKEGLREYKALMVESEILKKLEHPCLPRIVDIIDDETRVFIIMDYLEGINLRDHLEKNTQLTEKQTINIGIKLANVLDYLHTPTQDKAKIIYRDMKPSNIMYQSKGNIKLFDFGISREVDDNYRPDATQAMGTRHYASPEQFAHPPHFDERSDIYSLGMTLYRAISGHKIEVSPQNFKPITEWNPNASKGLEYIITKCTQQDPNDRYQSAKDLMYDLTHYEELDITFQNTSRKKLTRFLITTSLFLICSVSSATFFASHKTEQKNQYSGIIQQAEITKDTTKLEQAYALNPSDTKAYLTAINLYKEKGVFSKEDEQELRSHLNSNLIELQSSKNYGELAYELGVLYWFYYETSDQSENYVSSIKWFDDAIKYDSKDSKTAKLYSDIGKFYQDITLNITEGKDGGMYNSFWNKVTDSLTIKYPNEISNLQLVTLVYDAIENYAIPMANDGVSRNSLEDGYLNARKVLDKIQPTSEKAIQMKKELDERTPKIPNYIDVAFK